MFCCFLIVFFIVVVVVVISFAKTPKYVKKNNINVLLLMFAVDVINVYKT